MLTPLNRISAHGSAGKHAFGFVSKYDALNITISQIKPFNCARNCSTGLNDPAYLLLIAGKRVMILEHAVVVGKFFWNCLNNIPMLGNFPIFNPPQIIKCSGGAIVYAL